MDQKLDIKRLVSIASEKNSRAYGRVVRWKVPDMRGLRGDLYASLHTDYGVPFIQLLSDQKTPCTGSLINLGRGYKL